MRILVLQLSGCDTSPIMDALNRTKLKGDQIVPIAPDQKTIGDALIIPDFEGYDLTTRAFLPHMPLPPNYPGMHQQAKFFAQNMLNYWQNKSVYLVGFGHGAAMLWEAAGGKLELAPNDSICFRPTSKADGYLEDSSATNGIVAANNFVGFQHFRIFDLDAYEQLYFRIREALTSRTMDGFDNNELDLGDEGAPVPVTPTDSGGGMTMTMEQELPTDGIVSTHVELPTTELPTQCTSCKEQLVDSEDTVCEACIAKIRASSTDLQDLTFE